MEKVKMIYKCKLCDEKFTLGHELKYVEKLIGRIECGTSKIPIVNHICNEGFTGIGMFIGYIRVN